MLAGLWRAEPFTHEGPALTLRDVLFLPGPLQQPRIPVWTSCVRPTPRVLRRAARWDGVILAKMGEAAVLVTPPDEVAALVARITAQREDPAAPFDVVVATPTLPAPEEQAAYEAAGATWLLVAAYLDDLHALAQQPAT